MDHVKNASIFVFYICHCSSLIFYTKPKNHVACRENVAFAHVPVREPIAQKPQLAQRAEETESSSTQVSVIGNSIDDASITTSRLSDLIKENEVLGTLPFHHENDC